MLPLLMFDVQTNIEVSSLHERCVKFLMWFTVSNFCACDLVKKAFKLIFPALCRARFNTTKTLKTSSKTSFDVLPFEGDRVGGGLLVCFALVRVPLFGVLFIRVDE